MKKLLCILLAGVTFMSCNPKNETAEKTETTTVSSKGYTNDIFTKNVDSFFVDFQAANTKVLAWRNFIGQNQALMSFAHSSAFVIPASTIKYLVDSNHEDYVVFYIALNSTSDTLSLVYQGGKEKISKGDTLIEFAPPKIANNAIYALDNTWPCPVCPVNGLMSQDSAHKGTYTVPYRKIVPFK